MDAQRGFRAYADLVLFDVPILAVAYAEVSEWLPAPPETIPLTLRTEGASMHHRVYAQDGTIVAECSADCVVSLAPGRYMLKSVGGDGVANASRRVSLEAPTTATVSPRDSTQKNWGLVLAIAGHCASVVGLFGYLGASIPHASGGHTDSESQLVWGAVAVSGLVLIPIGWTLFGRGYSKTRVEPSAPSAAIAVAPTNGGTLLRFATSF